jgi:hypothetical protein
MSSDRMPGRAPFEPHPAVVTAVVLRTGTIIIGLTLILGLLVLPGAAEVLSAMSPGAAIGLLFLVSTCLRIAAGAFGARLLRRRYGTTGRTEALASIAVGAAAAWALYTVLVTLGGSSDGGWPRLLLELPRWIIEAGFGAVLVAPGESEPEDRVPARFSGLRRGDTGAASLEYVGVMFVAVLVVGSVVGLLTPVGEVFAAKICKAFGVTCGADAAQQRAKDLKVTCTKYKRDRDLGYNVVFDGVRGQRKDADSITRFGDGSATVVTSQGTGIGLDGGSSIKNLPLGYTLNGSINGDLGYVYRFPRQYGGGQAAQDFVDDRHDGWQQAAQIAIPQLQSIEEGASRLGNGISNWVQDDVVPFFGGDGPSKAEKEERRQEQRKNTADAVQVSLSLQGSVGLEAGNGVKQRTGNKTATGDDETATAGGALRADAKATMEVKGTATVGLDTGEPDSVPSSFTGSVKVDAEGTLIAGGNDTSKILPFIAYKGSAGAGGSYTVTYDDSGNPKKLVMTGEYKAGYGGGIQLPGGRKIGGKGLNQEINTHEYTTILDLDTSTPEGRANREAFDQFFVTTGGSVDGKQMRMSVPITAGDAVSLAKRMAPLAIRVSTDGFVVDSTYTDSKTEGGGNLKVTGFGLGGSKNSTTRTLVSATGYDLRNGGQAVVLANCEGK